MVCIVKVNHFVCLIPPHSDFYSDLCVVSLSFRQSLFTIRGHLSGKCKHKIFSALEQTTSDVVSGEDKSSWVIQPEPDLT